MPSLKVYNASTWKLPVAVSVYNVGIGWKPARRVWVASTSFNPSTLVYTTTWQLVANYTFPTTQSVPGVAIAKAPSSQITYGADVSWTVITDVNDDRHDWDVVVVFHDITTSTDYVTSQPQTAGIVRSPALPFLDQVNADVFYSKNSHDGPHTVTSTVTLGP